MEEYIGAADHVADGVYIGGVRTLSHAETLRSSGLTHILKLYPGEPIWPRDFVVFDNPIQDGESIPSDALRRGVDFVTAAVNSGRKVLVVCGAGISRSSTFVLAYLIERGHELPYAYYLLRDQHSGAEPHPTLWDSLFAYYGLQFTMKDVMYWYEQIIRRRDGFGIH